MIRAGFHKVCISPPIGAPLAGFAAREGVTEGIHDDLFARALVLADDNHAAAIVSVDVLALGSEFVHRVRERITQRTGIPRDAAMIASTHTHAGPVTIATFFNPGATLDQTYLNRLAIAIEAAVSTAWEHRFPARVGVGTGRVEGIGVNRRHADRRPVDEEVAIIKIADANGHTRAICVNYACHPTVLGPDNLLASADFPAFTIERIERALGSDGFAMYVNGTQGDISMGHSSELSAIGIITPGRTFERAAELGYRLGDAVLEALPRIRTTTKSELGAEAKEIDLPLKRYPPLDETARALDEANARLARLVAESAPADEISHAKTSRLYASITHFYAGEVRGNVDGRLPIELQGLRVDDVAFVAVPAEVFVEIGLRIKQAARHPVFLVGIANGYIGYLPTRAAYEAGGYEVVSAKCDAGSEDVLVNEALALGDRLLAPTTAR